MLQEEQHIPQENENQQSTTNLLKDGGHSEFSIELQIETQKDKSSSSSEILEDIVLNDVKTEEPDQKVAELVLEVDDKKENLEDGCFKCVCYSCIAVNMFFGLASLIAVVTVLTILLCFV